MITAAVTSKGQITIPKAVRDALRLRTGDRVSFAVHGQEEATLKPVTKTVDEVFGKLRHPAQLPMTVEQMNAAIAERSRSHR